MTPEIKSALIKLNRFKNYTYKVKTITTVGEYDTKESYMLYKQFHQIGKRANSTRMYDVELFGTPDAGLLVAVINAFSADKEY